MMILLKWCDIIWNLVYETKRMTNDLQEFITN
jgi:hypothetical protein